MRVKRILLVPVVCCFVLSACGGGSSVAAGPVGPSPAAVGGSDRTDPDQAEAKQTDANQADPGAAACRVSTRPRFRWPDSYPADLPQPPGAGAPTTRSQAGLVLTSFTTDSSLHQSVVSIVGLLTSAGYELGRGDSESSEAEAPFAKGGLRGVMKMRSVGPCRTSWLVAVTRTPLGATATPSA